jgi:hypothetical protein
MKNNKLAHQEMRTMSNIKTNLLKITEITDVIF